MVKYPSIKDNNFYERINKIYSNFTIPKKKKTFKQICFPKEYKLQLPQQFVSKYINPNTPYKGVLIYHRIGAGKTCTAIRVGENWKNYRKIIVVLPASLKGNFKSELRSLCAENNYLKKHERKALEKLKPSEQRYKEIISKSDQRIDRVYKIYSYNKFIEYAQNDEINLKNSVLIIDEIQNMISEDGTYYNVLYDLLSNSPKNLRIVLLSATPMFDKPIEIALTMNLLKIPIELPTGKDFEKKFIQIKRKKDNCYYDVKNMNEFKKYVKGYISYFRGAPPYVFPKMIVRYVKCEMSYFQYKAYKDVLKTEVKTFKKKKKKIEESLTVKNLPNNFFIGTRIISNVVFPNRKINELGFKSFRGKNITNQLEKYSTKFYSIMNRIKRTGGKIFIYSGFKEYGGIKSFVRVLDEFGYKNYSKHGEGRKRYAIWSGDENNEVKDEIREVYNNINNLRGNKIKILLGSPSIKEGVSLTAVRQVHILEPYWNQARLDQVIGRASRYCSHKHLPEEKQIVKVYIYIAVFPYEVTEKENSDKTVDEYIRHLSDQKNKLVRKFERALKESAVDCTLNKNANVHKGEINILCEK